MNKCLIKLCSISINGIKNINHGSLLFPCKDDYSSIAMTSNVIGIYGQNGSGKTAVVDSIRFLKTMMEGTPLPSDVSDYINKKSNKANFVFEFYINSDLIEATIFYEFSILKSNESVEIIEEKVSYKEFEGNKQKRIKTLIDYSYNDISINIEPDSRFNELKKSDIKKDEKQNDVSVQLSVAHVISKKETKSFVFSQEFNNVWKHILNKENDWIRILTPLHYYASEDLFIIKNENQGLINLSAALPVSFKHQQKDSLSFGDMLVDLNNPIVVDKKQFTILESIINEMNVIVEALIPSMNISIKNYGESMTEEGEEGIRFELLSKKDGYVIPLRHESEGIIKIISILSLLIEMYHNPSALIVIDEIDSGIFEYLLGEILKVLNETGKGQLLFTSHNLRPLEVLDKNSIYFTTTNPDKKFIQFPKVKQNNNLRKVYLRAINLGGQEEQVYKQTREGMIRRSFRKARVHNND